MRCFSVPGVSFAGAERILDIGTGTGVLALIAAQRAPNAMVAAVSIDDPSPGTSQGERSGQPYGTASAHRLDVRRMHATEPFDPSFVIRRTTPDTPSHRPLIGLAKHSQEPLVRDLIDAVGVMLSP
ncbi:MAG: hypothetical protein R2818_04145 [Flavobacteriales bacterium]